MMPNQQLLDFIKQELARGATPEEVRVSLRTAGWKDEDIEDALSFDPEKYRATVSPLPLVEPPKKTRKILLLAVALTGVLLSSGIAFGYVYYFPSTEKVLQAMLKNTMEMTSLEHSMEMDIQFDIKNSQKNDARHIPNQTATPEEKKTAGILMKVKGFSESSEGDKPKGDFSFTIKASGVLLGIVEDDNLTLGFDVRTIDEILYVRLTEIPKVGLFPFANLDELKNQWIKIDPKTLKDKFQLTTKESSEPSLEQVEKVKKIFIESKIFTIDSKLSNEKIDGIATHHYQFSLNKEGVRDIVVKLNNIMENGKSSEKELSEFSKNLALMDPVQGELWIGKKDMFLYKILLRTSSQGDTNLPPYKALLTLALKNHNGKITIETPGKTLELEEVVKKVLGNLPNPTISQPNNESKIGVELGELLRQINIFGDTQQSKNGQGSFSGACKDKNVVATIRKVREAGGEKTICNANSKAYAVSTRLPSGVYWCFDSHGKSSRTNIPLPQDKTECPKP